MTSKILINAVDSEEIRIAKVIDNKLEEFHDHLNNTRKQLMEEYDQLEKEREQIAKVKKNAKTNEDAKQANERIINCATNKCFSLIFNV